MQIRFISFTQNITSVPSLVMCEILLMRESYGGLLELKQMKVPPEVAYSLDMNEYEIGGENFHGDKDLNGEDCDGFERDFYNGLDGDGEIFTEDDDEGDDDIYRQLAQKEKDLLLAAELGKALLEKNEELNQKYELLQEEYSQAVEVSLMFFFWGRSFFFLYTRDWICLVIEQVVNKFAKIFITREF